MEFTNWLLFCSIAFVATISPGPAILLITSHSYAYGLQRSVTTMLGNISGLFLMSALSVAGLSAILLHSSVVFTIVKLLGAIYLVYLGIRLFRYGFNSHFSLTETQCGPIRKPSLRRLYVQGLLVALSNPKAIVFTSALFPQFVDPAQAILPQFLLLIVTFMLLSIACLFGYAYISAGARNRFADNRFSMLFSKLFGLVFIVTGGLLAGVSQK